MLINAILRQRERLVERHYARTEGEALSRIVVAPSVSLWKPFQIIHRLQASPIHFQQPKVKARI